MRTKLQRGVGLFGVISALLLGATQAEAQEMICFNFTGLQAPEMSSPPGAMPCWAPDGSAAATLIFTGIPWEPRVNVRFQTNDLPCDGGGECVVNAGMTHEVRLPEHDRTSFTVEVPTVIVMSCSCF